MICRWILECGLIHLLFHSIYRTLSRSRFSMSPDIDCPMGVMSCFVGRYMRKYSSKKCDDRGCDGQVFPHASGGHLYAYTPPRVVAVYKAITHWHCVSLAQVAFRPTNDFGMPTPI